MGALLSAVGQVSEKIQEQNLLLMLMWLWRALSDSLSKIITWRQLSYTHVTTVKYINHSVSHSPSQKEKHNNKQQ
ncbi:MAG: hypothetical protein J3R72DRAFT_446346 [Linnemannia gamsii]|nr:MAG: hypothetical protein J3R72DRAFT_446346 [Linnemannia gamsii]